MVLVEVITIVIKVAWVLKKTKTKQNKTFVLLSAVDRCTKLLSAVVLALLNYHSLSSAVDGVLMNYLLPAVRLACIHYQQKMGH